MDKKEWGECPWCGGTDRNFRPLRGGGVSCNNPWHNEDAQRANKPCAKHGEILPCIKCEVKALRSQLSIAQRAACPHGACDDLKGEIGALRSSAGTEGGKEMPYSLTWRTLLFLYVGAWVGFAIAKVGTHSKGGAYGWELPFQVLAFIAIPAFLGYCMGRSE